MGSDSDWPCMRRAVETLDEFGIAHEARVVSAHRMPDEMFEYAASAASRGLVCLIAGAGGAAHLPGMLAAKTLLPVLGVPMPTRHLGGQDSLHSIVQMPKRRTGGHLRDRRGGGGERGAVRDPADGDGGRGARRAAGGLRDEQNARAHAMRLPPEDV